MADTTFVPGTVVASTWLNDVNDYVYNGLGAISKKTYFAADYADATGVVAADTALNALIVSLPRYSELVFNGTFKLASGLLISNKNNLAFSGKGTLTLVGAASGAYGIQLSGTCDDLTFSDFSLVGEGNAAYSQTGIGNGSGQTLSRIRYLNLNVSNFNVGLSFAGNGGSCLYGKAFGNVVLSSVGVASGQGYGLHVDNAQYCDFIGNTMIDCQRHSFYHGRGSYNTFAFNKIVGHRRTVFNGSILCSLVVARSSFVDIIGNKLIDGYDGQMEISQDTSLSLDCSDILISDNFFSGRKNAVAGIHIGQQGIPTTFRAKNIVFNDNKIVDDYALTTGTPQMLVNTFNGLTILGNDFRTSNISGTYRCISLGSSTFIVVTADATESLIQANKFRLEGTVLTDTRTIDLDTDICTGAGVNILGPNTFSGAAYEVYPQATITNVNVHITYTELKGSITYNPPSLADGVGTTTTVTVTGCAVGDRVTGISFGVDLQGITLTAWVSGVNTVSVRFQNESGGVLDLASSTLIAWVQRNG